MRIVNKRHVSFNAIIFIILFAIVAHSQPTGTGKKPADQPDPPNTIEPKKDNKSDTEPPSGTPADKPTEKTDETAKDLLKLKQSDKPEEASHRGIPQQSLHVDGIMRKGASESQPQTTAFRKREQLILQKDTYPGTAVIITGEDVAVSTKTDLIGIINQRIPSFYCPSRGVMGYGVGPNGAAKMTIRGVGLASWSSVNPISPTHTIPILVDGIDTTMGIFGHPVVDILSMKNVEKIEVLLGPQPVLYGNGAGGGVISVLTKRQEKDGFTTDILGSFGSYNTTDNHITHRGKIGGFDYSASYNYRHTDGDRKQMIGKTTFTGRFDDHNETLHLGYAFNENFYLNFDGYAAQVSINDPGPEKRSLYDEPYTWEDDTLEYYTIDRMGGIFSFVHSFKSFDGSIGVFGNGGQNRSLRPAYRTVENQSFTTGRSNSYWKSNDAVYGARLRENARFFEGNVTTVGGEIRQFGGIAVNPSLHQDNPRYYYTHLKMLTDLSYFGYIEQAFIGDLIVLSCGGRHTRASEYGDFDSWQGGAIINPLKGTRLRVNAARGFKLPDQRQLYLKFSNLDITIKESRYHLKPEIYYLYETGIEQTFSDFTITITGYRSYSYYRWFQKKNDSPPPVGNVWENDDRFYYYGSDTLATYRLNTSSSIYAGYSYIDYEANKVLPYIPKHKAIAGFAVEHKGISLSVSGEYIKGMYYENPTPDDKVESSGDEYTNTNANLWRKEIPAYCVVDAKIGYRFLERWRVFINLYNISNARYTTLVVQDGDGRGNDYDYTMPGFHLAAGLSISL